MLEGHIRGDVHHNRHYKATLVFAPNEPMLLLSDSSPFLLRAIDEVHNKVIMSCLPEVPLRHRVDNRL